MAHSQLTLDAPQNAFPLAQILPDVDQLAPSSILLHGQTQLLHDNLARFTGTRLLDADNPLADSPHADLLISYDALSRVAPDDLDTLLATLARSAPHVLLIVDTDPADRQQTAPSAHHIIRSWDWWKCKIEEHFGTVYLRSGDADRFAVFRNWAGRGSATSWRPWQRLLGHGRRRAASRGRHSAAAPAPTTDAPNRVATCPCCETRGAAFLGRKAGYDIWECIDCRLVFADPMPTDAELTEFYQSHPRNNKYSRKADSKRRRAARRIARLRRHVPGRRFLDIGCSIGGAVEAAREYGFEATGIDLDAESIRQALQLFPRNRFLQATPDDFVQLGETFDLIFCTEVIEHVPRPDAFMQTVRQLLAPNGLLYITTPHVHHFRVPRNVLDWHGLKPPEHIALFGSKALVTLMKRHRLTPVHIAWDLKPNLKATFRAVD